MNTRRQAGVSLLEALVALVVMAVGAVAVVGMQATLRMNSDVAKQRSEASRLAQELVEQWRGFTALTATAGQVDWTDIDTLATPTTHAGSNTTFTRSATVVPRGTADDDPLSKTVRVTVNWADRSGQPQTVELSTVIAGILPELGGSLAVPADKSLIRNPAGRHPSVPPAAVNQGDGSSHFSPPGGAGAYWVFNNTTGLILRVCPAPPATCTGAPKAVPLTGFVRFATGTVQPTPALAEAPTEAPMALQVLVDQTHPLVQVVNCYHELGADHLAYYCAVPIDLTDSKWNGQARISGIPLITAAGDVASTKYKVCRYTPVRDCQPAVGDTIWGAPGVTASCTGSDPTPKRRLNNQDHPLNYLGAGTPLTNQNYLVIRAGFAGTAFTCPEDDTSTPRVLGATWYHQPDSPPP